MPFIGQIIGSPRELIISVVPSVEPSSTTITSKSSKGTVLSAKASSALRSSSLRLYVGMMTLALGFIPTPHCLSSCFPKPDDLSSHAVSTLRHPFPPQAAMCRYFSHPPISPGQLVLRDFSTCQESPSKRFLRPGTSWRWNPALEGDNWLAKPTACSSSLPVRCRPGWLQGCRQTAPGRGAGRLHFFRESVPLKPGTVLAAGSHRFWMKISTALSIDKFLPKPPQNKHWAAPLQFHPWPRTEGRLR